MVRHGCAAECQQHAKSVCLLLCRGNPRPISVLATPGARMDAGGPSEEGNMQGENRCPSVTYGIALLFFRCYFKKSAEKILAHQRLAGNEPLLLFFCC
jgi:hypothetical protein